MKLRNFAAAIIALTISFSLIFSNTCEAYSINSDIDNMILEFVKTEEGKKAVADKISQKVSAIMTDFYNSSGKYEIHSPFIRPMFNDPTETYIVTNDIKNDIRVCLVYLNDKAVGLLSFVRDELSDKLWVDYFAFPEYYSNQVQDDTVPIFGYGWLRSADNDGISGSVEVNMIFTYVNGKAELLTLDYGFFSENIFTDYRTIIKPIKTNLDFVNKYNISKKSDNIICSLDLEFDNYVSDSITCSIQDNNGKYLTYINGKYLLSENCDEGQLFCITPCKDKEIYTISPLGFSDKHMTVCGKDEFYISSAYYGQFIHQIVCKENGKYMNSKNGRVVFSKAKANSSFDWTINLIDD